MAIMSADGLLQIGEVAERVGLSLRTVRYYEEQGLLTPESRTSGGFRLFSDEQVRRLALIKQMKPIGFTIQEMRALLDARDTVRSPDTPAPDRAAAREQLAAYADDAAARCEKLRKQLSQADGLADDLRREAAGGRA
jgi:DNA-binding transcriptional MerR regulator